MNNFSVGYAEDLKNGRNSHGEAIILNPSRRDTTIIHYSIFIIHSNSKSLNRAINRNLHGRRTGVCIPFGYASPSLVFADIRMLSMGIRSCGSAGLRRFLWATCSICHIRGRPDRPLHRSGGSDSFPSCGRAHGAVINPSNFYEGGHIVRPRF